MTGPVPRIAVIRFPGMNCEEETRRAVAAAGMECDVFMWNGAPSALEEYDGYVLPGGFSYQDRVRAGAIAAKDHIVECIFEQAMSGKPVIGICNGAQILLEAGLVPGLVPGRVEMSLARNVMPDRDGYHARWVHLRIENARTCVTIALERGAVVPIPVAHAEGRFVTADRDLVGHLFEHGQVVMRYARPDGTPDESFPWNPNGSVSGIAAIANPWGNVVAMMPHPERSAWLRQVPDNLPGEWGNRRRDARARRAFDAPGPGARVFESILVYLRTQRMEGQGWRATG